MANRGSTAPGDTRATAWGGGVTTLPAAGNGPEGAGGAPAAAGTAHAPAQATGREGAHPRVEGGRGGGAGKGEGVPPPARGGRGGGGGGLGVVLPGDVDRREELKVRLRGDLRRVDVDHDAVRAGCRKVDAVAHRAV